jgi:hypothetical protein
VDKISIDLISVRFHVTCKSHYEPQSRSNRIRNKIIRELDTFHILRKIVEHHPVPRPEKKMDECRFSKDFTCIHRKVEEENIDHKVDGETNSNLNL